MLFVNASMILKTDIGKLAIRGKTSSRVTFDRLLKEIMLSSA